MSPYQQQLFITEPSTSTAEDAPGGEEGSEKLPPGRRQDSSVPTRDRYRDENSRRGGGSTMKAAHQDLRKTKRKSKADREIDFLVRLKSRKRTAPKDANETELADTSN
ncbi:hypothetical protein SeMB42_g03627 [Synchytrium endobioticum]|uniref:Uncharacterized protein n=1 Tax=Synchytrium endobioticum TaxID=286115 RepID=A0A507D5B0_9FUNG|nr:hypothetical protein SeMB42_g03627 [Synchytrium endobioticum]